MNMEHYKKTTNADRIRTMTDEEMALLFARYGCPGGKVFGLESCDIMKIGGNIDDTCKRCWLDWLKMEKSEYINWRVWSAIQRGHSAFKFDVFDFPTVIEAEEEE